MEKDNLSFDLVRELFSYDEKTGVLRWRVRGRGIKYGSIAGTLDGHGYFQTGINGKKYLNHRLVYLYHRGYLPENDLDHINQNKTDNRIENLREVSRSCNMRNSGDRVDNTSGIKGVYWHKNAKKWMAHIRTNGKNIHLGCYISKLDAAVARHNAEIKYNWSVCNTFDSTAYKYIQENS